MKHLLTVGSVEPYIGYLIQGKASYCLHQVKPVLYMYPRLVSFVSLTIHISYSVLQSIHRSQDVGRCL